jgi:hypothetical protein
VGHHPRHLAQAIGERFDQRQLVPVARLALLAEIR